MKYLRYLLLILMSVICTRDTLQATEIEIESEEVYEQNPYVDPKIWNRLKPHFLPADHPIKRKLDKIFSKRVSRSQKTLEDAGFKEPYQRPSSKIIVTTHPELKEYIIKLYPDCYHYSKATNKLMDRITGAVAIRAAIKKHKYGKIFKVPKKWIYPLPVDESLASDSDRKDFILVAEDMHILPRKENYKVWKSSKMTKEKMNAVFTMIQELGLVDSDRAFNIPFCEDGKIAFIDTEHHHKGRAKFEAMMKYLSHDMRKYVEYLLKHGVPTESSSSSD